ncbi:MAG: hypothetical protein M3480_04610 [Verrucomicrobiota bacterium]|nr:hypothetical protein [Verrucomicrobiota bacterium]
MVFSWWDRIHRTLGLNIPQSEIVIGVSGYSTPEDNHFLNTLLTVLIATAGLAYAGGVGWLLVNWKVGRDFPDVPRIGAERLVGAASEDRRAGCESNIRRSLGAWQDHSRRGKVKGTNKTKPQQKRSSHDQSTLLRSSRNFPFGGFQLRKRTPFYLCL